MKGDQVHVLAACRTPIGRHGGGLARVRPDDLAAVALGDAIARSGVGRDQISEVFFGCANQAGEDNRNVARMAVLLAELPVGIPAVTVNRLCGSGLEAVAQGARCIAVGDADLVASGGVESMTRAPWVLPKAEKAFPAGPTTAFDTSLGWRLVNPKMEQLGHTDSLGQTAENVALERAYLDAYGFGGPYEPDPISREAQDAFALASHQKAIAAMDSGRFEEELVPVPVGDGGEAIDADEGPRRGTSLEALAALRPAFVKGGSVTAGNSSSLNDGAAALVLGNTDAAASAGLTPMATIRSVATAGVPPRAMGIGPLPAARAALDRAGLTIDEIGLIELNEAFAAQSLAVLDGWGIDRGDERVNVNGGAIALGHPLGCSGARILTTLVHEMGRRPDVEFGMAAMCIGVGQGIAMVVQRPQN